ncbi:restriction endonuclease subunit S [Marinomonas primoryensis]|uniref:restriction endonuclease subunit S n=1 Tax=Marinomonas primoryensis TaxID=178399 RepID=UPI003704CD7D
MIVPQGWEFKKLGGVAELQRGFDLPSSKRVDGCIPIISSGGLTGFHNEFKAKAPGVVTGRYGSIGSVFYIQEDFWPLNTALWVKDFHSNDPEFIYYMLSSFDFKKFSDKTGVPGVNRNDLHIVKVGVPPVPEQRKIAQILSTWDKAIVTTEKLIAASQQQKKALMQQLLTGKKRFAGFSEEWKEVRLLDIGKCITGLTYSPSDTVDENGMLVLRSSNIQGGKLAFDNNVFVKSGLKVKSKTKDGDILICVRNGSKNLIGKSALIKGRASNEAHGAFMSLYRCKYPDYIFQLFQTSEYYRQVNRNLGATINSINNSDLHDFRFIIPTDKNEISMISKCLTSADQEIDALQSKLAYLKQEKKALMQQLLTGKRRVVLEAETSL